LILSFLNELGDGGVVVRYVIDGDVVCTVKMIELVWFESMLM